MKFWLSCTACGKSRPMGLYKAVCECGGTLLVDYDLDEAKRTMTKEQLRMRSTTMWRYRELLPIGDARHIVSLGEGWTPLIRVRTMERSLGLGALWVKREEQNPTGSFKSRGFSAALSIAKEYGITKVAVNSNGNAASALAAYAGAAGMEAYVFVPRDCPVLITEECARYGAHTVLVDGLIHDAGSIVQQGQRDQRWYNVGTLKEPGRAEGKKTMGLELAEQLNWTMPDVIVYPTGGGSGIIGIWRALMQLKEMGFICEQLPRIVAVQELGCTPIVDVMASGRSFASMPTEQVTSLPTGMRVPDPPDGQLIVSILRSSGGTAVAVSSAEIQHAQEEMGRSGISASPEGAATWSALLHLHAQGWIQPKERVVLFNTCHAMKYWSHESPQFPVVRTYQDWLALQSNQEHS